MLLGLHKGTWAVGCGFGLHLSWVACLFYQGFLFDAVGNGDDWYWYYLASMVALVATLLLFGVRAARGKGERLFAGPSVAWTFAAMSCAGSVLTGVSSLVSPPGAATFVASALLTGVGSAYINVMWGRQLVRHREIQTVGALCLAYALHALLYFAVTHAPVALMGPAVALLPLGSMLVALRCEKSATFSLESVDPAAAHDEYALRDVRLFARKLIVAAVVFGVVQGAIQGLMNALEAAGGAPGHASLVVTFSGVPLLLMVAYMENGRLQTSRTERFVVVYRVALLAMIGALLISSVQGLVSPPLRVVMLAGYTFFKIVVWAELCQICRTGGVGPLQMFAFGEASITVALLLGNSLVTLFARLTGDPGEVARVFIALCVALLLLAYLFILTERRIIAIEEMGKAREDDAQRFRFQDRADDLARRFGLTKREAEVFKMFVRGRSTARIAEDLYVSSGTVSTHLRNVYRKANVHSRQELLDLFDAQKAPQAGGAVRGAGKDDSC